MKKKKKKKSKRKEKKLGKLKIIQDSNPTTTKQNLAEGEKEKKQLCPYLKQVVTSKAALRKNNLIKMNAILLCPIK
jgi:hypothetical protein